MSKYTMEEIMFTQANGISFMDKYEAAGETSIRNIILSVSIGTDGITFIY